MGNLKNLASKPLSKFLRNFAHKVQNCKVRELGAVPRAPFFLKDCTLCVLFNATTLRLFYCGLHFF